MKFTSMFFTASAVYLRQVDKDSERRAKKKQARLIFFIPSRILSS